MVLKIRQLIKGIGLLLSSMLLVLVIVFAEARQANRPCRGVFITIGGREKQQFVEERDLLKRLNANTTTPVLGTPLQLLKTRHIENIVKTNNFVREGVVYKSWKGDLKISILPRRPIARVICPYQQSQYIDEDGVLLPLSEQYTARVLLVEVEQNTAEGSLREYTCSTALLALLNHIDRDPFWRAQITYVHIDKKGKVVMHTQIGKQRVEFGSLEAIEEKLTKLMLFYKQIIPSKGWNAYKRVNLAFDNQIVCE
jgi:cell division protein FtsQ